MELMRAVVLLISLAGILQAHPKSELIVDPTKEARAFAETGLTPKEAHAFMEVPEGFSVDLLVAEPGITQPIAMCFDARGRIWVAEGHTYPRRAPEGAGKDRIVIFEDADGNGSL